VLNPDGRTTSIRKEQRLLEIKPGYSASTPLCFKGEGHENVSRATSNLIFKLVELPHFEYSRKGSDLFMTKYITLVDALNSKCVKLTTLDNRMLRVPMDEIITYIILDPDRRPCAKLRAKACPTAMERKETST
jgi:DnaJ-class molecular chaperone